MPYEVGVQTERRLGVVRCFGSVTGEMIVEALEALYTIDGWKAGYDTLWDVRKIESLTVTPSGASDVLDQIQRLRPRMGEGRVAIVAHRPVDYALAVMLCKKASSDGRERNVFYAMDEARDWLRANDENTDTLGRLAKGFLSTLTEG